jgi:hypothetical protein
VLRRKLQTPVWFEPYRRIIEGELLSMFAPVKSGEQNRESLYAMSLLGRWMRGLDNLVLGLQTHGSL